MTVTTTSPAPGPTAASDLGLAGKVAVVTGAARGLGAAIARKLCACGVHVTVNYRSSDDAAERLLAELEGLPGTATAARGDVRDPEALGAILDGVAAEHGRLDLFVHNAATMRPMAASAADVGAVHDELRLALDPLLHAAPALAQAMAGNGRVVLISGNGAHEVIPFYVATGVAKAAAENLVRYLAVELGGRGIAVNAVATHLLDKGEDTVNKEAAAFLATRTPNGRLTRPEDVAEVVALLCTDGAGWIQGQTLAVDGGLGLLA
jgi:enoyl-[acyl-carrier protein] reductase III